MSDQEIAELWARLRFSVISQLLVCPPQRGELQEALDELATRRWRHPITNEWVCFARSTIERWYYTAQRSSDPIRALRRRVRSDAGRNRVIGPKLLAELELQYRRHPQWSYQLHADNLIALVAERPELGPAPSYTTVRRRMKQCGFFKRRRRRNARAERRFEQREVRSYEVEHVHALWHFDYHEGSRRVLMDDASWRKVVCLGILDDCSRLSCHTQWYLDEDGETLAHGQHQAFLKRGLPRAELSDNGGPMIAEETQTGFRGLSIVHETTLPNSPEQNGKQEKFWDRLEGRLCAMLEHVEPLTLGFLNLATQAWVELEYNRGVHDELGVSPLERMLAGPNVARPSPSLEQLRFHFTICESRHQRRSDGTISIAGVRFELPSRMRHLERVRVRYRRWDLSRAYIVDPRDSTIVLANIHPLDKLKNADRRRRRVEPIATAEAMRASPPPPGAVPPLLRKLLADYAQTGLPPAYIPFNTGE